MQREKILEVVLRNIRLNVDELAEVEIDPQRSVLEYGASSLDLVEIVSYSMRDLGISVPRTEFAEVENIDQLVDVLARHVTAGTGAAGLPKGWREGEI